jgi:hypothetical protein
MRARGCAAVLASLLVTGCAPKMTVVPAIDPVAAVDFALPGKIVFDGKRDYLPRTLAESPGEGTVTLRYAFDVIYGKDRTHAMAHLFNPLVLFGFPIGEDTVAVAGKLDIERSGEVVKTYTAICGFEKTRNLFHEGATYSELRLRGLQCVRDNIDAQMQKEREFLSRLTKIE